MTVAELLERIIGAYPGATPAALKSFTPVFYARLKHREGDKLDEAATEVFGSFHPKASKPFPIPADFEAHLPSLRNIKADSAPIGKMLDERHERAQKLYAAWHGSQGLKIKAARAMAIYGACSLEAYKRCKEATARTERIMLSPDDIAICEQRAVTSERVHRFGRMPASPEVWHAQCAEIRADWQQKAAA